MVAVAACAVAAFLFFFKALFGAVETRLNYNIIWNPGFAKEAYVSLCLSGLAA